MDVIFVILYTVYTLFVHKLSTFFPQICAKNSCQVDIEKFINFFNKNGKNKLIRCNTRSYV